MTLTRQDIPRPETEPEPKPAQSYELFAQELVKRGKIQESEIVRTQWLAVQTDEQPIPALLVNLGAVSERDTAEILAEVSGVPLVTPADYPGNSPLSDLVSPRFLKANHVVGLAALDNEIVVAVTDPFDSDLLEALALACDRPVRPCVGLRSEIDRALEKQFGPGKTLIGEIVGSFGSDRSIDEAHIKHLGPRARSFIQKRLCELSGESEVFFAAEAVGKIATYSRGIPHSINRICSLAMFTAQLDGRRLIAAEHIDQVAERLLLTPAAQRTLGTGGQTLSFVIDGDTRNLGYLNSPTQALANPKHHTRFIRSVDPESEQEHFMSRLDNLNRILKNLQSESPGVEASALISEDGLMIASAVPQDLDETRVAGMTATLLNLGTRAATELRRGDVQEVIVRGEQGYAVMISAGRGALLLVLANEHSKLGLIFFDMREAIKAIKAIL